MFEGKELEGKIGDVGSYSVDVNDSGLIEGKVSAEKAFSGGVVGGSIYVNLEAMPLLKKLASKIPLIGKIFEDKP